MSDQIRQPEDSVDMSMSQQEIDIVSRDSAWADDMLFVEKLRRGDEAAFVYLLDQHSSSMLRLAMIYASNRAVAEEIVQEAWMGVIQGLERFEGRCLLKTWIFRILMNCAKTRSQREGRSIPFSSLASEIVPGEPTVDPERFLPSGDQKAGGWVSFPRSWGENPEERLLSQETQAHIRRAIELLPPRQREVITLRDIEGWTASETSSLLDISEVNQRVLLHRARAYVRRSLEQYFNEEGQA